MKKLIYWAMAMTLVIGIGGYAYAAGPIVNATPMVKMDKDAKVFIMGAGFEPIQAVKILHTDENGVTADIESSCKPAPVVSGKSGEWSTVWSPGRFISKKLIEEGITTLRFTDKDYNLLAHVSIYFYKDDGPAVSGEPPLVVADDMVDMSKDAEVAIQGVGFKPNQQLAVLFTDANGATADIEAYLEPSTIVTDGDGTFAATWKCGRYVSKKLIEPGVTAIRITDTDYDLLAHDSIAFME